MSAFMASAGIPSGPAAFPFLSVMMAFLISALVGFSQLMSNSISAGGMSGNNSGMGRFSSSLKCSIHSLQLFLYCRQWFSVFVLYWHVSLLELACQLLGGQMQVFKIALTGCFLRLTGQVIDVVPLSFLMLLFTSLSATVYSACAFDLAVLVRLVFSADFLSFLVCNLCMVSAEIHSLCWAFFLPRSSSHVSCQRFLLSSHCASRSVSLSSISPGSSWNLLERLIWNADACLCS